MKIVWFSTVSTHSNALGQPLSALFHAHNSLIISYNKTRESLLLLTLLLYMVRIRYVVSAEKPLKWVTPTAFDRFRNEIIRWFLNCGQANPKLVKILRNLVSQKEKRAALHTTKMINFFSAQTLHLVYWAFQQPTWGKLFLWPPWNPR